MEPWVLGAVIKPFVALALFLAAAIVARVITRLIPEGRLKRLLLRRVGP